MWVMFFKSMLDVVLRMLKNPAVVVGVIGLILCSLLYIKGLNKDNQIIKLKTTIDQLNVDYSKSKNNEKLCIESNDKLVRSQDVLKVSVKALQDQVRDEQKTLTKWKNICQGVPVNVGQVPSKPLQNKGVIVDEKGNSEYIKYFNSLFGAK